MSTSKSNLHLRFAFYALYLGFVLSRMGFADYAQVHMMFTFTGFNLFLGFCAAVTIAAIGYWTIPGLREMAPKPLHKGSVIGGIIFGVGWALTGACPSVALVMIGGGQFIALASLVGIFFGSWIYPKIHRKFFGWDMGSCAM